MAEEIRVLYVALTRAENLLLLFGSATEKRRERWVDWGIERLWPHQLLRTNSMLDWIGSFLCWKQPGWAESKEGCFAHLRY
jgi:ATP-dependent exoDNAse (exonuclease V) beta subunit